MHRKVCVVLTARASYAKLKSVLTALQNIETVELQFICAASALLERFGQVKEQAISDGFQVSENIWMQVEGENLLSSAKSTGLGIIEFSSAFDRLKPDVVVVMADRYEVISPAIAATYLNIPLAHIQGGEVTGNIDEKVRHAITKLADLHFPATELAQKRLISLGEHPDRVFWTGCPSIDIAKKVVMEDAPLFDIYTRYGGVGTFPKLDNGYIMVMQHSVTTAADKARDQIKETMEAVDKLAKPTIWFWPNPDAGSDDVSKSIRNMREQGRLKHVHFIKNMEPADFLSVLYKSSGILGNSSAAIREASFLGIPALNIGDRQENRERGPNVLDVGYNRDEIYSGIMNHLYQRLPSSSTYGDGNAGPLIANKLATAKLTTTKSLISPDL